jgi:tRNA-dihydrouridine synthase B
VLRESLQIPVVGNGDVWYAKDALRMQAETGCDAVMIGRPAIRNPWIFEQIAALREGREPFAPGGDDVLEHLHRVRVRYAAAYGDTDGAILGKLKEMVNHMLRGVPGADAWNREALRMSLVADLFRVLETRLAGIPSDALDLDAHGRFGLERSGSALLVDRDAAA